MDQDRHGGLSARALVVALAVSWGCQAPDDNKDPVTSRPSDSGTPTPPTPETTDPTEETTTPTTPTDTAACVVALPASWEVGAVGVDPSAPDTTCTDPGPVDFTLVTEWVAELPWFVMNVTVAPSPATGHASVFFDADQGGVELDGASGAVVVFVPPPMGYVSDDGSSSAVGDVDGDGWTEHLAVIGADLVTFYAVDGTTSSVSQPWQPLSDEVVQFRDVNLDGDFEQVLPVGVIAPGVASLNFPGGGEATGAFVADLEGDGTSAMFNSEGVWDTVTGAGNAWDPAVAGNGFYGVPVDNGGDLGVVFYSGSNGLLAFGHTDGTVGWTLPGFANPWLLALGDASGDSVPDVCAQELGGNAILLLDLSGTVIHRWPTTANGGGGCSMADLDADGIYEVLVTGNTGFRIFDGVTGDVLAEAPELRTFARDSAPVVADIDGDGSAEILVVTGDGIVALGAASGRWARTRPVWHQLAYDITSIRDDGSLVSAPVAPWSTYEAYRAQPSHDGVRQDLAVTVVVDEPSAPSATMEIAVTNLGSAAAPAGAVLRLVSWDGSQLQEVVTATIDAEIQPGERVDTTVTFDACVLESLWFAEVISTGDECDYVNDRVEGHP